MENQQDRLRPFLLSLLVIALIGAGIAYGLVQGMRSVRGETAAPPIRIWHGQNGDLWVQSPLYRWNITGGDQLSYLSGGEWRDWTPHTSRHGERIIDRLFLSSTLSKETRSRVLVSLPDRAVVYLERESTSGAIEVLELAFRSSDGIVRVTHAWIGADLPNDVIQAAKRLGRLEGQFIQEMMQGLNSQEREHLAANYTLLLSFDASREDATRTPFQQAEAKRIGTEPPACSISGDRWMRGSPGLPTHDPCQFLGFFLPGRILGSEYLILASDKPDEIFQTVESQRALNLSAPDLDAGFIMRTPRYSFRAAKTEPELGDTVSFMAHVANSGRGPSGTFAYRWSLDGIPQSTQSHPSLDPQESVTLTLDWAWQIGVHTVTLQLDPDNQIVELSEWNNSLQDRTDALAVGFWVERSVYDYFNAHQVERGLGSNSWEDWAQRQLATMNKLFAQAIHPLTPQGILDRVRLDKVVVVPDGTLPPCTANQPDPQDLTVDLQWGFPADLVGIDSGRSCELLDSYFDFPFAQDIDFSLLHELSHARYLVDLGGLDLPVGRVLLSDGIGRSATELPLNENVELGDGFPVPVYLAIDGELVICQTKERDRFSQCSRGAEGTTPRSHSRGTPVHLAVVRLQDGQGNLVLGSDDLPVSDELLFRNPYPEDLMSGGVSFGEHSTYAWNRIAGQRPCCGNANAPANIGEYLNEIPAENIIELRGSDGLPIPGARLEIYRARPLPVWYGKVFMNTPDAVYQTDALGQVHLQSDLFSGEETITHQHGHSNALVLLKFSGPGWDAYRFLDITQANIAYWSGDSETATYSYSVEER